jgi:hypothetical protein
VRAAGRNDSPYKSLLEANQLHVVDPGAEIDPRLLQDQMMQEQMICRYAQHVCCTI